MGIGRMFDSVTDWAMEGSTLSSLFKTSLLVSIPIGAVVAPFIYVGIQNSNALDNTINDLDDRPTEIFTSVAACEMKVYQPENCTESFKIAIDISNSIGTTAAYSSQKDCIANHRTCNSTIYLVPITTYVNNTPITTYINQTYYSPPVVAWQAAKDDLTISVPLYQGPQSGTAMRWDGKIFALNY